MSDQQTTIQSFPVVLPADPTKDPQATTKRYTDAGDQQRINRDGDSMSGPLVLAGDPVANNEAATKAYVDSLGRPNASQVVSDPTGDIASTNVQAALGELAGEKVARAGDAMTGPLILDSDTPSLSLEAAPKSYVDKMGSLEYSFLVGDFTYNAGLQMYEVAINHDLNRRPKVTLYDDSGIEFAGDIAYNVIGVNGLAVRLKFPVQMKVLLT
jgi:hypothetical protein